MALVAVSIALVGGVPATAAAQDCAVPSPTQDQYCPSAPPPQITTGSGSTPPPSAVSGGALPFTGYDVGIAALAATALIGAGFGLRRAARADEAA